MSVAHQVRQRQFPCTACGANLEFAPGASRLVCPYCGADEVVPERTRGVEPQDYLDALGRHDGAQEVESLTVTCEGCGAVTALGPNVTASRCAFCDGPLVAQRSTRRSLRPRALLPFTVERRDAEARFREWLRGRWFAPSDLARRASEDALAGVYLPAWIYDCETTSHYEGERGEWYYETETYTVHENGKEVTRTRQVRHTRWYSASGTVHVPFEDIMVHASASLPRALLDRLAPWDLGDLVAYDDRFLSGFRAECYQVDLEAGFEQAQDRMAPEIEREVRLDIGGDEQRIDDIDTEYEDIGFRHVLLPVWVSAYRYRGKVHRFVVNARSGAVQGERPYSVPKIAAFVLLVAGLVYLAQRYLATAG
jgi:predicted RNA-binding Zn-ribbon protein involved in translation (DUF1610 family)